MSVYVCVHVSVRVSVSLCFVCVCVGVLVCWCVGVLVCVCVWILCLCGKAREVKPINKTAKACGFLRVGITCGWGRKWDVSFGVCLVGDTRPRDHVGRGAAAEATPMVSTLRPHTPGKSK